MRVTELRTAFHRFLAEQLQSRLNAHLKTVPQESYQEKQALASQVNRELRELGLSIRCPRTGLPAILIADVREPSEGSSRFRLEVATAEGGRRRTYTAATLPDLELMVDNPRCESLARSR